MAFFTVVIPTYNDDRHITEALQSVLRQSYKDTETIIVYDPSNDTTERIIDEFAQHNSKITILKNQERLGVAASRNIGMQNAKGEYIAFLDADDVWTDNKLSKQHELIVSTGCEVCYSSYSFIDENGNSTGRPFVVNDSIEFKGLLYGNIIGTSTCIISRKIAEKFAMNDAYYHEDYVFWLTVLREGYLARGVTDVLVKYRLRKGSRSSEKLQMPKHRWAVYRNYLGCSVARSLWYSSINLFRATIKYAGAKR